MSKNDGVTLGGWIKLYRVSLDKGWLRDRNLWAVWTYCLLRASHEEHSVKIGRQEVPLLPGQFIFGRFEAARELHMKPATLYKIIRRLETGENLNIKSNNKFSLITVVNWELYQGKHDEKEHQKEHVGNIKVAHTRKEEGKKEETRVSDSPSDDSDLIPFRGIIDFLNEKTGKRFRHSTRATQRLIKARWKEGFRLKDFLEVIQGRCDEWLSDPKMVVYLRPETLFGTKFESYLNADAEA